MERSILRSAVGRVSEAGYSRRLPRSRPGILAAARAVAIHPELRHVQHAVVSNGEYVRLRGHDLWRRDGAISEAQSRLSRRQLRLDSLVALAHGRIRGIDRNGGTSRNETRTAGIFPTPVLGSGRMR